MIRFLRSLTGQIVILLLLAAFVGWSVYGRYRTQVETASVPAAAPVAKKVNPLAAPAPTSRGVAGASGLPAEGLASMAVQTGASIARLIVPETPVVATERVPEKTIPKKIRDRMLAAPEPLTLFVSDTAPSHPAETSPAEFAPYGRMIRCKLVTGLESSNLTTPLVAITTEDLWHRSPDGIAHLIIPAGVEVHGPTASHGRLRDRLEASGAFVFVWRTSDSNNGRELVLKGIALTRDTDPETGMVRADDGTGGIRGELIETANNAELKLFAAAFLQAAASGGLQTNTFLNPLTNTATSVLQPTLRNAGIAGSQAVIDEFAGRIRKQLTEDGSYVAVPAGREFYVYVPETIQLSKATRGGIAQTRSTATPHADATP
jgi:hypothetical protein